MSKPLYVEHFGPNNVLNSIRLSKELTNHYLSSEKSMKFGYALCARRIAMQLPFPSIAAKCSALMPLES